MSQIKTKRQNLEDQMGSYAENNVIQIGDPKLQWLIQEAPVNTSLYFKGETGDRYHIYVCTKHTVNTVRIYKAANTWNHDMNLGNFLGTINKKYHFKLIDGTSWWGNQQGECFRQLMRKGLRPRNPEVFFKINFVRSAYVCTQYNGEKFVPWEGMIFDLKNGLLVNKPNRWSKKELKKALTEDKMRRKANYHMNKNNRDAIARLNAATHTDGSIQYSKLPVDDVFKYRNMTHRTNLLNYYGLEEVLKIVDKKIVDEDTVDGRPYRVLDVEIPDYASGQGLHRRGLYLEMINPSTGESHFEGVPNTKQMQKEMGGPLWGEMLCEATVKAALAWRDQDADVEETLTWGSSGQKAQQEHGYTAPDVLT